MDDRNNYDSPSPVSDGENVVFFYGTGDLVAFKLDGTQTWKRLIENGKFSFQWTFSSSPALSAMDHPVYDVWVLGCEDSTSSSSP